MKRLGISQGRFFESAENEVGGIVIEVHVQLRKRIDKHLQNIAAPLFRQASPYDLESLVPPYCPQKKRAMDMEKGGNTEVHGRASRTKGSSDTAISVESSIVLARTGVFTPVPAKHSKELRLVPPRGLPRLSLDRAQITVQPVQQLLDKRVTGRRMPIFQQRVALVFGKPAQNTPKRCSTV